MSEKWKFLRILAMVFVFFSIQSSNLCHSLNDEGLALLRFKERIVSDPFNALADWREDFGELDSCSWFGVECFNGKVVVLDLKDLCLGGTLAPELSQLLHIKSIVLRNNSFTGAIPEEIGELKELELLDLGCNDFDGSTPVSQSEFQADDDRLELSGGGAAKEFCCVRRNLAGKEDSADRRMVQEGSLQGTPPASPPPITAASSPSTESFPSPSPSPSPSPPPLTAGKAADPSPPTEARHPDQQHPLSPPPVANSKRSSGSKGAVVGGAIGGAAAVVLLAIAAFLLVKTKVTNVNPWATGLSGQLKKALVTGVPKLKRSELETACEDFSNVIGTSSIGTLYKGTLSSGVEIAVACVAATSAKEWSENLELQFLKKIETLSKVNHKNFVNLIGYCKEDEPFTRMMVFEYAPNGTLFEHLHIREAEHLDWGMRLRVAMGMAYCLDYMHQLERPIPHSNLSSSAIRLTEDYAAKIAEFSFWNEAAAPPGEFSGGTKKLSSSSSSISPECNVYNFGVILFEMVTGRVPYTVDSGSLENWASDYLTGDRPLKEMADPTLHSYDENQLEEIGQVIRSCVHRDPRRRPEMREVCIRLREVTGVTPDGASPRISPLWWAELELMSESM